MTASLTLIVNGDRECAFRNSTSDDIVSDCYKLGLTVQIDDKERSVVYTIDGDRKNIHLIKLRYSRRASSVRGKPQIEI